MLNMHILCAFYLTRFRVFLLMNSFESDIFTQCGVSLRPKLKTVVIWFWSDFKILVSLPFCPSCRFVTEVGPARGDNSCRVARWPLSSHRSCCPYSSDMEQPNDLMEIKHSHTLYDFHYVLEQMWFILKSLWNSKTGVENY